MGSETLITVIVTASLTYAVPIFWRRVAGTRYRTEKDCQNCATKRDLAMVRQLVVELAIKAGVPAQEVARLVSHPPHPHE